MERVLLSDETWGPILERYQAMRFRQDVLKALAGRVSNLSDVIGVYRRHHPDSQALVQRIEATDRLIDLIVYRLYGLTEEEAVVEGDN